LDEKFSSNLSPVFLGKDERFGQCPRPLVPTTHKGLIAAVRRCRVLFAGRLFPEIRVGIAVYSRLALNNDQVAAARLEPPQRRKTIKSILI
jgi:hypothetical protein